MLVIDRIEGGIAVCETEDGRRELPLAGLPAGVREGDCVGLRGRQLADQPGGNPPAAAAEPQLGSGTVPAQIPGTIGIEQKRYDLRGPYLFII